MCAVLALSAAASSMAVGKGEPRAPQLTVAQIVAKNVAARGGLEAWRKVDTMVWTGHMEVADGPERRLGFLLEQKRPNKTHFEITSWANKSVRVFDGERGWKARADRDGRPDVRPFGRPELDFAREAQVIDGPLVDYASKGITVTLAGVDAVEGRPAYRLAVQLPSGSRQDIWIDTKTFLDVKYDRTSVGPSGQPGIVSVLYRGYQSVEGLKIPSVLEIGAGSSKAPDKMVIEKVALNPPLEDAEFAEPGSPRRHSMASSRQRGNGPRTLPPAASAEGSPTAPTAPSTPP